MANKTMHHAVIWPDTFELVDQSARADVSDLKNALPTKAEQDGAYPDLTAGQMLSKVESADSVPYNFRAVGQNSTLEYTDAIVGGSVVGNQLITLSDAQRTINEVTFVSSQNGTISVSGTPTGNAVYEIGVLSLIGGHTYFLSGCPQNGGNGRYALYANNTNPQLFDGGSGSIQKQNADTEGQFYIIVYSAIGQEVNLTFVPQLFDLTQMLGTTIGDYVYSLETATLGTGIAWLNKHFSKIFGAYQPYNAGEIVSVQGLSQHIIRDADNNIIGTYPLDSTKTFRGILKLDSNNQLYADGDRYLPDGTVQRRYGVVDLGTLDWSYGSVENINMFYAPFNLIKKTGYTNASVFPILCPYYTPVAFYHSGVYMGGIDKAIAYAPAGGSTFNVTDSDYTDATTFKAAMSGVMLLYEVETPTTEEADPYTAPQIIDPNGTEEYVSTSIVPVGHESRYPDDLRAKLDALPWDLSMIAPIENGDKVSQTYTVGKYFLHNNQFCKAKTDIASGATLTLNTNYEVTTVADEIYSALH